MSAVELPTDGPDNGNDLLDRLREMRKTPGGQRHWMTHYDEDGEPYGELCWCAETGGKDHD